MKKIKYIIIILFVGLFLASCSGNGSDEPSVESYYNTALTSLKDVKTVSSTSTLKEGSAEVYKLVSTITVTESTETGISGNVSNVVSQYSSGFQYTTTTTITEFNDSSLDTLFNYNLKSELFSTVSLENNTLDGVISKDNVSTFLNDETISCSSDLNFKFVLEENKIISLDCSYTTNNSRRATISVVYTY